MAGKEGAPSRVDALAAEEARWAAVEASIRSPKEKLAALAQMHIGRGKTTLRPADPHQEIGDRIGG